MSIQLTRYRGYEARVTFDTRDEIFVGRVIGIEDRISFHGATVAELASGFHAAVDDYLDDCQATGQAPASPVPEHPLE